MLTAGVGCNKLGHELDVDHRDTHQEAHPVASSNTHTYICRRRPSHEAVMYVKTPPPESPLMCVCPLRLTHGMLFVVVVSVCRSVAPQNKPGRYLTCEGATKNRTDQPVLPEQRHLSSGRGCKSPQVHMCLWHARCLMVSLVCLYCMYMYVFLSVLLVWWFVISFVCLCDCFFACFCVYSYPACCCPLP